MEQFTAAVTGFVVAHQAVAPLVALILAMAETTAVLSLVIPSTALLMAVGATVSTGAIPFMPIWAGAASTNCMSRPAPCSTARCTTLTWWTSG